MKIKTLIFKSFARSVVAILLICAWTWAVFALYLNVSGTILTQYVVTVSFALILPGAFLYTQSFYKGTFVSLFVFIALLFWWQTLTPTHNKDWAPDVSQISHGRIDGDLLTMYGVRNFDYEGVQSFHEHWETRTYNLSNLQGIDIFLSYWDSEHIAHTILSWDFGEGVHLPISIETRKDKTQEFSSIKGFFKQYEIAYIAADERDIIRLRTNYRKERVYLYKLKVSKNDALALLKEYLAKMNSLFTTPEFYNALTHNCTTTIHIHTNAIRDDKPPLDWRLIASGHVDKLLYDRGVTRTDLPFIDLRTASRVDLMMQQEDKENFSTTMREHIQRRLKMH